MTTYQTYLTTLRRVPDDIVLSVATREMEMSSGETCLCGWFVKEQVGRLLNMDPEAVDPFADVPGIRAFSPNYKASEMFGGGWEEWSSLYNGAEWDTSAVEEAFVERVLECVP